MIAKDNYPDYILELARKNNWKTIKPVTKGWSSDKKYFVQDTEGFNYLLRISEGIDYSRKEAEYNRIVAISKLNINSSLPIGFGYCNDKKNVYILLSWVEGKDAHISIPLLPKEQQYISGYKAGIILDKIHRIKSQNLQTETWEQKYSKKVFSRINLYNNCPIKLEYGNKIISYLENNLDLLHNRPITLQHGDFHIGNFILNDNSEIGIIDFNRSSYGDPWEEYDRFYFTWTVSKEFAKGQIHGYFNNNIPENFFKLMALYSAVNIISSILWAIPFGEKDVTIMIKYAGQIYNSYHGFETTIPDWYTLNS